MFGDNNVKADLAKRFDLSGTNSLVAQVKSAFGVKPVALETQLDLFKGFDVVSARMPNGDVYQCLATDGVQVSDWRFLQPQGGAR